MGQDLIKLREQVMDRADRALDAAWPARIGEDYVREMRRAVDELTSIAAEMRKKGLDPVEQSRTYRHLGSVYSDLEPSLGKGMLLKAKNAYQAAETLLEGQSNDLERAKLNFNFANTLRQIDPNDIEQLQEAKQRLLAARAYFAMNAPQYLAQVDAALQSVEGLLRIAPLANAVKQNTDDMAALQKELAAGGKVSEIAEKAHEVMKRGGGVAGLTGQLISLVESLPPELKKSEEYANIQKQLESVTDQVRHIGLPDTEDRQILKLILERLESEARSGKVVGERAKTLGGMLDHLETILSGSDADEQAILGKLQKLREFTGSQFELVHYLSHGLPRPQVPEPVREHLHKLDRIWGEKVARQVDTTGDIVDCSLFAPANASPGSVILLQAFVHFPENAEEARALAKEYDDAASQRGFTTLDMRFEHGSILTFDVSLNQASVEDSPQHVRWCGRTSYVSFMARITDVASGILLGKLVISQNGVPVGRIRFQISVTAKEVESSTTGPIGTARHYRKAFISYATADRNEVLKRTQMLDRLHIDYFQDVLSLDPGERWERKIYRNIESSDLFLLFWSYSALASQWVLKELDYAVALKHGSDEADPEIMPVIIEGPPPPPPPRGFEGLHFNDRFIYFIESSKPQGMVAKSTINWTLPVCPRAAELVELNWQLRRYLLEEMNRPEKGEEESKEALDLSVRASRVDRRIYEAGADNPRALTVEKEELRPMALAVRAFSARMHSMPARPIWHSAQVPVDSNAVFYSGSAKWKGSVAASCLRSGLETMAEPRGESYSRARWQQLQKAVTTVFDLRVENGPNMASVTYELGIALTLGRPVVVLVAEDQTMPFDVDIDPVVLAGGPEDDVSLATAIDRSVVWTYPRPCADASSKTLEYILSMYQRPQQNVYVDQTLRMLAQLRKAPDPLAITRTLVKLFDYLKDGETMLVHPWWSPVYPEENKPRLFHIMPFRPQWADRVTTVTRELSEAASVKYVRGDEVAEPNVIRSIWEEIARATHVLVDLTGFNANVALELGIVHTLGNKVLMVGQGDPKAHVFQSISRFRVQSYDFKSLEETLGKEVRKFLLSN